MLKPSSDCYPTKEEVHRAIIKEMDVDGIFTEDDYRYIINNLIPKEDALKVKDYLKVLTYYVDNRDYILHNRQFNDKFNKFLDN